MITTLAMKNRELQKERRSKLITFIYARMQNKKFILQRRIKVRTVNIVREQNQSFYGLIQSFIQCLRPLRKKHTFVLYNYQNYEKSVKNKVFAKQQYINRIIEKKDK